MITILKHNGLRTESYSPTRRIQRQVLAQQIRRERRQGNVVSPIVKRASYAVIQKGTLQAIKRIDVDPRLCYGAKTNPENQKYIIT